MNHATQQIKTSGPCACQLTPAGRGAVATIGVRGLGAVELVGRLVRTASGRPFEQAAVSKILLAHWHGGVVFTASDVDGDAAGVGEEVVMARTGGHQVEIHCHGGQAAAARILDDLQRHGCTVQLGWDWAAQTWSPLMSQAAVALTAANTRRVAAILLDQYQGALDRALDEIAAHINQGRHDAARRQLDALRQRSEIGRHLTRRWIVVIAGRPNVGKSSLVNAIVGYRRSLVYDQPGTTRDALTATTAIDGWPVELIDTAGLRESACAIESAGVQRARRHAELADLVVLVSDASRPWSTEDQELLDAHPRVLLAHNKRDLVGDAAASRMAAPNAPRRTGSPPDVFPDDRPAGIAISAMLGWGIPDLLTQVSGRLVPTPLSPGDAVPFNDSLAADVSQVAAMVDEGDWSLVLARIEQLRRGMVER